MSKILCASLFFLLSLSGCSSFPLGHNNYDGSDTSSSSQKDWYPLPSPGDQIAVTSKSTGTESTVTVIDAYHAASGRSCGLYTVNGNMDTNNPSGLACRENGKWINIPFIVNPDAHPSSN